MATRVDRGGRFSSQRGGKALRAGGCHARLRHAEYDFAMTRMTKTRMTNRNAAETRRGARDGAMHSRL
jgi:hypothetical protein